MEIKKELRNKLILRLNAQGISNKEIANMVGLTTERVRTLVLKYGGDSRHYPAKKYELVKEAYLAAIGDKVAEEKALEGIKRSDMSMWLKRNYNIETNKIARNRRLIKAVEMHKKDLTIKQIAKKLKCSSATIMKQLHEAGIYTLSRGEKVRNRNEEIKRLFKEGKADRNELAEMFNTSYANIGLILTDKHYKEYSPQYHANRHIRKLVTNKKKRELTLVEETVLRAFKEHKKLSRIVEELKKISNKYNINQCYRVLKKNGYSVGNGQTYDEAYGLV